MGESNPIDRTGPTETPGRAILPERIPGPFRAVVRRLLIGLVILLLTSAMVYLGREGYRDSHDGTLTPLDSLYYATVSLSTTGYGDITPVSQTARATNVLVITPLRLLFLIALVGTTLEVLADRTRRQWRLERWRASLSGHTVVIGYGTKGRSAVGTLLASGIAPERIVVVDPDPLRASDASAAGLAAVVGDGTDNRVLLQAGVDRAERVVVATHRDDTAVLTILSARALNPRIFVVAACREEENAPLLRQSGADSVVLSSGAAGRLLGVSTINPRIGTVVEDLIEYGSGLEVVEVPVTEDQVGRTPTELPVSVLGVVRAGRLRRYDDVTVGQLLASDRLLVVRSHAD